MKKLDELYKKISKNMIFLTRCECKTLVYLLINADEFKTSREIEHEMCLRQPEVSMAISFFRKKGWIKQKQQHKKGEKGRPTLYFKLSKKPAEILNILISEVRGELESKMEQLKTLQSLSKEFD